MANDLSLDQASLVKDLEGAQRALGIQLVVSEEREQGDHLRVSTRRTFRVALPAGAAEVRARFVRQGLAQEAKKLFVKEIEVGDKTFDDAVYIATDTADATRTLVNVPRVREALVALVKAGCQIDASAKELVVSQSDAGSVGKEEQTAQVLALAAHLLPRK